MNMMSNGFCFAKNFCLNGTYHNGIGGTVPAVNDENQYFLPFYNTTPTTTTLLPYPYHQYIQQQLANGWNTAIHNSNRTYVDGFNTVYYMNDSNYQLISYNFEVPVVEIRCQLYRPRSAHKYYYIHIPTGLNGNIYSNGGKDEDEDQQESTDYNTNMDDDEDNKTKTTTDNNNNYDKNGTKNCKKRNIYRAEGGYIVEEPDDDDDDGVDEGQIGSDSEQKDTNEK